MEYCPEVNIDLFKFELVETLGRDDKDDMYYHHQGTLESLCLGTENGLEETM